MKIVIVGGVAGGFRLYSSIKNEELLSKQCYTCGMEK